MTEDEDMDDVELTAEDGDEEAGEEDEQDVVGGVEREGSGEGGEDVTEEDEEEGRGGEGNGEDGAENDDDEEEEGDVEDMVGVEQEGDRDGEGGVEDEDEDEDEDEEPLDKAILDRIVSKLQEGHSERNLYKGLGKVRSRSPPSGMGCTPPS